jgi:DNA polymerase III subunit delta'
MPWDEISGQESSVAFLRAALARGRAHHAYLFAGPKGVGKELLARLFAQAVNCEATEEQVCSVASRGAPKARSIGDGQRPCGACAACMAIRRGSHPDVTWVLPQAEAVARGLVSKADLDGAPSREIRVDEVRALSRRLALAPAVGRRKVAIVTPAEALNERAQNTLLKTLEEPAPATTFILVSSEPDSLLATVRSRCLRVQLTPLHTEVIEARLVERGVPPEEAKKRAARSGGSLGRALELEGEELDRRERLVRALEDAASAPDERAALELAELYGVREVAGDVAAVAQEWTRDLLVLQAGGAVPAPDLSALAQGVVSQATPFGLLEQATACADALEALEQNGNGRLQLERLLLRVREIRGA